MKKEILFWVGFFLALGLVSAADFSIRQNSSYIDKDYLEGDVISGILNMSFNKQENLYFTNNLNNQKIRLLDVFNATNFTRGIDYFCEPINCLSYYSAMNGENEKKITLGEEKQIYGFKISEQNNLLRSFDELEFSIEVWVEQSCTNQIAIDLFNDGKVDFYNNKPRAGQLTCADFFYPEGGGNRGCFDEEDSEGDVPIGTELYCEYMKDIPPAASYEIGGYIDIVRSGGDLSFAMYPVDGGNPYGGVWLNGLAAENNKRLSRIINYSSLDKFDALVCVYTKQEFVENFKIKTNEDENVCGLAFEPGQVVPRNSSEFELDFNLFIEPRGFEELRETKFDKEIYERITGRNLKNDVFDYLNYTYGLNCSGANGCIIPFSVWGLPSNSQYLGGAKLRYKIASSGTSGVNRLQNPAAIYQLTERPAKVSAGWTKIPVEKMGFKAPEQNGKHTFRLFLGGEKVIEKIINVDIGFPFDVKPRFAYIGRETIFNAETTVSINQSVWNFGDGTPPVVVQGASAKHTFNTNGEYDLRVTLLRGAAATGPRNSTKRFKIIVGDAKTSADLVLKDYEAKITKLESDIGKYSSVVKNNLVTALSIESKKSLVQSKRQEFQALNEDAPESRYVSIINDLLNLDLPESVYTSKSGTVPSGMIYENADMAHIKEIEGQGNLDENDLKASIFGWMEEHYGLQIYFETISVKNNGQDTDILKTYKITLTKKKEPAANSAYLIIGQPKNTLTFISEGEKFSGTSISGGSYVDIKANPLTNVEFLIVGASAPEAARLGAYISPPPSGLGINQKEIVECWVPGNCDEEGKFLWKRFFLGIGIILFLFLVIYILLQYWYKNYYEKHLFPNSNDLYNLLNFIYNSRRNGLKDSAVKETLRQRKWTSEQINYAFRKLEGKRTGMWEIPLFKFLENRKVRKELEKQQGKRQIDTRFIKRPNL